MTARKFITTPIFYVNSVPHIGHLYTAVVADTLARWYRFTGHAVKFATGTDEHGLKIQQAAAKNQRPVQAFCDDISSKFRHLFDRTNISYTDYIRTSEPKHHAAVRAMWTTLDARNQMYPSAYHGWYSVSDEAFLTPADLVDGPNGTKLARDSGQPVELMAEETIKFRLSDWQAPLAHAYARGQVKVVPGVRERDVLAMLASRDLMSDLSVSRPTARVQWGIQVPEQPDQTIYVWLDALTNYLTVCGFGDPERTEEFARWWRRDQIVHVIGKDIVKFHGVYWPAFLMAAGLDVPGELLTHAHWTVDRTKMSKSRGNVVDPNAVVDKFGADAVRYYLMLNGGVVDDGDWSADQVTKVYKKELAGQLGNLYSRATSPALNPLGVFPAAPPTGAVCLPSSSAAKLHSLLHSLPTAFATHMDARDFSKAIQLVVDAVAEANRYFAVEAPWTHEPGTRLDVVYNALETARMAGLLLQCVMPGKAGELLDRLGVESGQRHWEACRFGGGGIGSGKVSGGEVLFPKIK
ncbi:hypothetical protein BCR44DRAFT_61370 [Catenaria anguillulae PL171]|uniref:methionine--tRNA ligase n=1 Tax=Catenaria anguillulae PL171 TaxID=765915 RepID=A0A1Y2HUR5_9FUNG|nr:hypothetical protein BCR44DRAFT_61370 [Catenaria anguillulae PL171]